MVRCFLCFAFGAQLDSKRGGGGVVQPDKEHLEVVGLARESGDVQQMALLLIRWDWKMA
jgi:hypothetical protein